jgi:hypothetical protein
MRSAATAHEAAVEAITPTSANASMRILRFITMQSYKIFYSPPNFFAKNFFFVGKVW